MKLKSLRDYCLNKTGVYETFPFDEETLVFKVGSKMFALTNIKTDKLFVNLKCDPDMADGLRRDYTFIKPGYHMNKRHWNTVELSEASDEEFICWMIDNSYDLVFKSLKKNEKEEILKQAAI